MWEDRQLPIYRLAIPISGQHYVWYEFNNYVGWIGTRYEANTWTVRQRLEHEENGEYFFVTDHVIDAFEELEELLRSSSSVG